MVLGHLHTGILIHFLLELLMFEFLCIVLLALLLTNSTSKKFCSLQKNLENLYN